MTRSTGAILAAALVLAGCGVLSGPDVDMTGDWSLVTSTIDGQPFDALGGHAITLSVHDGQLTGSGGCNQYGGSVEVHGADVTLGDIFQTEMACLGDGIDEAEGTYMDALRRVNRPSRNGDVLTLSGPSVTLRFHLS